MEIFTKCIQLWKITTKGLIQADIFAKRAGSMVITEKQ